MTTDAAALLDLAADVARQAGRLITDGRAERVRFGTKSTATDVVTEMDTASERLIVGALLEARPGDAVLGEEGGAAAGSSRVRWVIDPIDGTVNYLYGLPPYAVSIAAEVDGQVAAGVVYDPVLDEMYAATRGGGATCNGVALHCSAETVLGQALVATGFGYAAARRARQAQLLCSVLPAVRDIRRQGSAALDLCSVARGRVDAYYERGLFPWDLAAGELIAREAGAKVTGLGQAASGYELMLAAGPSLHPLLQRALADLRPDTDG